MSPTSAHNQTADNYTVTETRLKLLQLSYADEVNSVFRKKDCSKYIELSDNISANIINLIVEGSLSPSRLFEILQHDSSPAFHFTNVTIYIVLLALEMGITDRSDLDELAMGAMLHDIGTRTLPESFLFRTKKIKKRDAAEYEIHPTLGYVDLCERDDITTAQLMMAYQHHEYLDGTGYPVGILEEEMHPYSKMLAVVDAFDTKTMTNNCSAETSAEEALAYLNENAPTLFKKEIVQCWTSIFQQQ